MHSPIKIQPQTNRAVLEQMVSKRSRGRIELEDGLYRLVGLSFVPAMLYRVDGLVIVTVESRAPRRGRLLQAFKSGTSQQFTEPLDASRESKGTALGPYSRMGGQATTGRGEAHRTCLGAWW